MKLEDVVGGDGGGAGGAVGGRIGFDRGGERLIGISSCGGEGERSWKGKLGVEGETEDSLSSTVSIGISELESFESSFFTPVVANKPLSRNNSSPPATR